MRLALHRRWQLGINPTTPVNNWPLRRMARGGKAGADGESPLHEILDKKSRILHTILGK